ncbi:MAG: M24 family metallopeptidase [bacterium]|nr:M24 family metallopeptidase [bacterium]
MKRFYVFLIFVLLISLELFAINPYKAEWLKSGEFARRREALMAKMEGGVAIFKGADLIFRNYDIHFQFRQESNFYYLTGFEEPGALFLLVPGATKKFIMFVKPVDPIHEMWHGKQQGIEAAKKIYGVDEAYPVKQFETMLPGFLTDKEKIYCGFNDKALLEKVSKILNGPARTYTRQIRDPRPIIAELRLIKSNEELRPLQKAIDITGDALEEMMRAVKPGMKEYEVEAILSFIFKKGGADREGFPFVVASGPNASVLHYITNTRQTRDNDLLLVDIGAEYGYYSADITRTIPVNGKYSPKQKEVYNIVLKAQQNAIAAVAPGKGLKEVMDRSITVMQEGLFRLGLVTDKKNSWQTRVWCRYLHISHWLGIDTHDVGDYRLGEKKYRILETGMVFTIEPGIYIEAKILDKLSQILPPTIPGEEIDAFIEKVRPAAETYNNISVRIEDDVLVTKKGYRVLSAGTPKQVAEIEKLMKETSRVNQLF